MLFWLSILLITLNWKVPTKRKNINYKIFLPIINEITRKVPMNGKKFEVTLWQIIETHDNQTQSTCRNLSLGLATKVRAYKGAG